MIVLWGLPAETPLASVGRALDQLGARWEFLDQRQVLAMEVRLTVDTRVRGWVRTATQRIDLTAVSALYVRPYATGRLPAVCRAGEGSAAWRYAHQAEHALWSWVETTPALVVNRSSAMASNNAKPYQAERIRRLGFAVPATLVTTDPRAARAFWERHGQVVYKSVSGIRSQVARLQPHDAARLPDVAWCPTQFQEYVPGREHRVHVVGDDVFACEITSDADDYRYASAGAVQMCTCRLPSAVADTCRRLAVALGLPVAGIDLRRRPDGVWYCFEVNPSPAFTAFEDSDDRPISAAVARLLADAATP
jgi:hypothetical protein